MTDTYELEKIIRMKGYTKKQIAQHLNLSEQAFLLKLSNQNEFKASEIKKMCELLALKDNKIFFVD